MFTHQFKLQFLFMMGFVKVMVLFLRLNLIENLLTNFECIKWYKHKSLSKE